MIISFNKQTSRAPVVCILVIQIFILCDLIRQSEQGPAVEAAKGATKVYKGSTKWLERWNNFRDFMKRARQNVQNRPRMPMMMPMPMPMPM